ncbi:hypothetical protein C8Q76DRAFT_639539 [Earliella scabrosa]|nr:hypothetical protein C8Q76DRAFT_639539 [Earliella scabrosa]
MKSLPLEIWQRIFALACTDGGQTGTALALVSRFFHAASHPIRFLSLSLYSLRHIEQFLSYLRKHATSRCHLTPKVKHLLLAFRSSPHSPCQDSSPELSSDDNSSMQVWYQLRQIREQDKAVWDSRFMTLVPILLEFVGPHLETFALLQSDGIIIPAIRHPLPRLRELTLLMGIAAMLNADTDNMSPHPAPSFDTTHAGEGGSIEQEEEQGPPTRPAPATPSLGHGAARFPALERLHLVCGRHRDWTLREPLARLPGLAPALTHLRISNATYTHGQDDYIPAFLRAALGVGPPRDTEDSDVRARGPSATPNAHGPRSVLALDAPGWDAAGEAPAMPRLRRVVLHSVPPPSPGGRCASPYKDYDGLVGAVRDIAVACERREGARVAMMEGERLKHREWERIVEAQWMARVEGGYGCWEVADADAPESWSV